MTHSSFRDVEITEARLYQLLKSIYAKNTWWEPHARVYGKPVPSGKKQARAIVAVLAEMRGFHADSLVDYKDALASRMLAKTKAMFGIKVVH